MAEILLSSEAYIKSVLNISDNIAGKYLLPSLREAQEIGLRGILGDCLLDAIKGMVKANDLSGAYKSLVEHPYFQNYLAYQTAVELVGRVSYKVANFGVVKSTDENLQVATQDEIAKQQCFYQAKADSYCNLLQHFLLDNRTDYPELTCECCKRIESNLYSAATCGIFLGGARNRTLIPIKRRRR